MTFIEVDLNTLCQKNEWFKSENITPSPRYQNHSIGLNIVHL